MLWLSSGKYYRKSYDTYETYMTESVSGLNLNAPVRYRGVDVGRVRRIVLAPGNVEQVQVTLDIERGTPVKEDTVATLQTQGLTGIAYHRADRRDTANRRRCARSPGEPYPVIASAPSLMSRLETARPCCSRTSNRVSDNLNALLDEENRRAVKATLADLAQLSRTLAARSATIDATLASTARRWTRPPARPTRRRRSPPNCRSSCSGSSARPTRSSAWRAKVAGAGASARGHARRLARRPRAIHRDRRCPKCARSSTSCAG